MLTAAVLPIVVSGCTIAELKRDVAAREASVRQKEVDLKQTEERSAALQAEKNQLLADLDRGKMTDDELERRIAQLRAENRGVQAANAAQQQRKQQLEEQLAQVQARMAEVKRLPPDQRPQQIAALKKQLRILLEIGAN
jgi:septal ring factor EnvC (AmiA/AmiB activator)